MYLDTELDTFQQAHFFFRFCLQLVLYFQGGYFTQLRRGKLEG